MPFVCTSACKAAAMNINDYRAVFSFFRCPYIQKKAVISVGKRKTFSEFFMIKSIYLCIILKCTVLISAVAVFCCVINTVPAGYGFRISKPLCRGISDSAEFSTFFAFDAAYSAAGCCIFNIVNL